MVETSLETQKSRLHISATYGEHRARELLVAAQKKTFFLPPGSVFCFSHAVFGTREAYFGIARVKVVGKNSKGDRFERKGGR